MEHNPAQIDLLRRFGWKVFYGDASRIDLLRAAGAAQAKLLVLAIDEPEKILHIVDLARKHFPHLKILARASDRRHAYALIRRGVEVVQRETFNSALEMGVEALVMLGERSYKANRAARIFKWHDEQVMHEVAHLEESETVIAARSRQMASDLEKLLQADDQDLKHEVESAWDTSALRKDASHTS